MSYQCHQLAPQLEQIARGQPETSNPDSGRPSTAQLMATEA